MEYYNLQELKEAVAMYVSRMDDVLKRSITADLDEAMLRLDNAMSKTDVAGIPAMLCRFDVHDSKNSIFKNITSFILGFDDFLKYCKLNMVAMWKIDNTIGRKEKFIREVVDSLKVGRKALDEKGRTTPTRADKESEQLITAYINGDFPCMTLEQFINDMLLQGLVTYEKKRRVDYLLGECSGLITDDMRKMMLQACEKPAVKPEGPAVVQEPEKIDDKKPRVEYLQNFNVAGLNELWAFCQSETSKNSKKRILFDISSEMFIDAVRYADFSEIIKRPTTKSAKLKYLIVLLSKYGGSEWYHAAAKSIGATPTECSKAKAKYEGFNYFIKGVKLAYGET